MRRWTWSIVVLLGLICFLGWALWFRIDTLNHQPIRQKIGKLPVLNLDLNGISWDEFKAGEKETKYTGNVLSLSSNSDVKQYLDVAIKGRGNLTWTLDKRPFQFDLGSSDELFGITKAKKWAMLANYLDKSYLRNDLAFYLAEMLGQEYSFRGKFVDFYINGEYEGLYYLLPKVEIQKNVVDLRNEGGILVEMDDIHREECFLSHEGHCLQIKDAVDSKNEEAMQKAMADFLIDYNTLEIAAKDHDYKQISELIDVESFAKYYLINEFAVNPDAYSASFYFYKNGADDKIHAGPIWDFDLAFGNTEWAWHDHTDFYSPTKTMVRYRDAFGDKNKGPDANISKTMYYLMDLPEFQADVKRLFNEKMSGREQELTIMFTSTLDLIRESAIIDSEKWRKGEFEVEAEYLLDWVKARYDYFEQVYGEGNIMENRPIL